MPNGDLKNYEHRARAVGIVVDGNRILATRVQTPLLGDKPHWLWPGGKVEGAESLEECAEREVREETGLQVQAERLIYVYQSVDDDNDNQNAEFFFLCNVTGGELGAWNPDIEAQENILDARFVSQYELIGKEIWPERVTERVWDDLDAGFPEIIDLGFRRLPTDSK
ncbi:MAG: NUDIX hydrolase [Chloroflexi bacterium]|jgi:8-oxo-dGTP pyrophosphatase MutT (NUDIX family)|nr:NUDIX hydrolase [Chloroflexota bacterium]MBT4072094.1 NUDIX hydrolase [Chloroflexota bacterium]MBT4514292.1 NUDIX hydrolase [Chloroflexota bacterium]MBT6681679.1 NUDIX hydrolase [Chloroflexota bacterium]